MGADQTVVPGNVTPTGTPTGGAAAPEQSDRSSGFQARIDGLTAEKNRYKEQAETLAKALDDQRKASQTEAEKLMDARAQAAVDEFKKSQYEPLATKASKYEAHIKAENERMRKDAPPEAIPADFEGWDPTIQNSFLRAIQGTKPTSVGAVPNQQPPAVKGQVAGSEFRAWQATNMYNPEARKEYEDKKAAMTSAYTEGRIDWNK